MFGVKPYLSFNGNCREAINFYKDALGGEILFTQSYGESPMKGSGPDDAVMHCTLKVGDSHIMAADICEGQAATAGNNISLAIGSNDPEGADAMFEKMSDGATITMPMQETFWAARFGMLTDKFGMNWMFNCDKPHEESEKATA